MQPERETPFQIIMRALQGKPFSDKTRARLDKTPLGRAIKAARRPLGKGK